MTAAETQGPAIAWVKPGESGRLALDEARSRTQWERLVAAAAIDPDKIALVAADDAGVVQRLSYRDLIARVRAFSGGLVSIGVARGDRVVLWMTNRLEWIISAFAAGRIGAAVVPVNTFLKPAEVAYCIAQSGARHLIMLDRFRRLDMPAILAELVPAFARADAPGGFHDPALPDLRTIVMFAREGGAQPGAFDWDALEARGRDEAVAAEADRVAAAVSPDDILMIKYTSGSTGFPKGVILQQGRFVGAGLLHGRRTGMARDDVYFSMMPFFHAGGSLYGQMSMLPIGGRLVFTEAFDVALAVRLMREEAPTIFVSVLGKEVVAAAHAEGISFPSVWLAQVPDAMSRAVLPNARFSFTPYGLTESYAPAALTGPDDPSDKRATTAGRLLDGNEIRVVDPVTGRDVAPGEIGEAWLRGNMTIGYWNKPEETARLLDAEGWLHSEDLVSVDAEGFVRYVGRIKLMAKVGGENVSLEEVERVAGDHAAILHCAAVGVADARKAEAVRLYVVTRPGTAPAEAALREWLSSRLAHFKQPRDIVYVADLPRLANGKLDRIMLTRWAGQAVAA